MQLDVLVLNMLFGTYCGYKTNEVAVKALFEEQQLGPLHFGGFIVKQRKAFAESVGALVEREIINAETLREQLAGEHFRAAFGELVQDVLQVQLPRAAGETTIGELADGRQTLAQLEAFSAQALPSLAEALWQGIARQLTLADLVGPVQQEKLVRTVLQAAFEQLRETGRLAAWLQALYESNQACSARDFLPEPASLAIQQNAAGRLAGLHVLLIARYREPIERLLDQTYETAALGDEVRRSLLALREKPLRHFFARHEADMAALLGERLLTLARSAEGRALFDQLAYDLLAILKDQSVSLLDLLTPDFRQTALRVMQTHLPRLLDRLLAWLEQNKKNIEALLEASIDEVMAREHATRKLFKDLLHINVTDSMGLFGKLMQYLEAQKQAFGHATGAALTDKLIALAGRYSLGELAALAQAHGWLQEKKLAALFNQAAVQLLEQRPALLRQAVEELLALRLGVFLSEAALGKWQETAKAELFRWLVEAGPAHPRFTQAVQAQTGQLFDGLYRRPLGTLFAASQVQAHLPLVERWCLDRGERKLPVWPAALLHSLPAAWQTRPLEQVLPPSLCAAGWQHGAAWLQTQRAAWFETLPQRRVADLLQTATRNLAGADAVRDLLLTMLSDNLDSLLAGNVAKTVVANLERVSEPELSKMVQDFMGKEMSAINLLGAVLGGAAGLGLGALSPYMPQQLGWSLAANTLLQAGVGYGTNCQALWMLFKPYQKSGIPLLGEWLTPGVIVKNQARFAGSMGGFVGESLLAADSLAAELIRREAGFIRLTRRRMLPYELAVLGGMLSEYRIPAAVMAQTLVKNALADQKAALLAGLGGQWLVQPAPDLRAFLSGDVCADWLLSRRPAVTAQAVRLAQGLRQTSRTANDWLPAALVDDWLGRQLAAKVADGADWLQAAGRADWLLLQGAARIEPYLDRPLAVALPEPWRERLQQGLVQALERKLADETARARLREWLDGWLQEAMPPERQLQALSGGKLFQGALQLLPAMVAGATELLQGSLERERGAMKDRLLAEYKSQVNWVERTLQGGETIIPKAVDHLIDVKWPQYLAQTGLQVSGLLEAFLHRDIGPLTLRELGIRLDGGTGGRLLDKIAADARLPAAGRRLAAASLNALLVLPPRSLLQAAGLPGAAAALQLLQPELQQLCGNLGGALQRHSQPIAEAAVPLARSLADELLLDRPLAELLQGVDEEASRLCVERLLDKLFDHPQTKTAVAGCADDTLATLAGRKAADLLDEHALAADLASSAEKLLADEGWLQPLGEATARTVGTLAASADVLLRPDTRQAAAGLVGEGLVHSLQQRLVGLLAAIRFPEVTERRVKAMNPAEIQAMFDSFAAPSFRQIKRYGLAGGLLGLLAVLAQRLLFGV